MRNGTKRIIALLLALLMIPTISVTTAKADDAITVFCQTSKWWRSHEYKYNNDDANKTISTRTPGTFQDTACGLFALANAVYYMNGTYVSPDYLAQFSVEHGDHVFYSSIGKSYGTANKFYQDFAESPVAKNYGVAWVDGEVEAYHSFEKAKEFLEKPNRQYAAICSTGGHFMALVDYRVSDGKYLLLDSAPSGKRLNGAEYGWRTERELRNIGVLDSWFAIIRSTIGDYAVFNGTFELSTALNTNRSLDVAVNGYDENAQVQIFDSNWTDAQVFTITHVSNGWHSIKHGTSSMALSAIVWEYGGYSGAQILQRDYVGADNQLWRFVRSRNGGYEIQNKKGYYLDVKSGDASNRVPVQLWEKNGTNAQLWYLKNSCIPELRVSQDSVIVKRGESVRVDFEFRGSNVSSVSYRCTGNIGAEFGNVMFASSGYRSYGPLTIFGYGWRSSEGYIDLTIDNTGVSKRIYVHVV